MRKTRGFISGLEQCVYYLEPPIFYANILYFRLFILSLHSSYRVFFYIKIFTNVLYFILTTII